MKRTRINDDTVVTKASKTNAGKRMVGPKRKRALSNAQAAAVSKMVERKLTSREEAKYYDSHTTLDSSTSTTSSNPLNLVPLLQGTGDESRVGDMVRLKYLTLRYTLQGDNGASAPFTQRVRVIVFQWKPKASAGPRPVDLIDAPGTDTFGYYNLNQIKQAKILYDRRLVMSNDPGNPSFEHYGEVNITPDQLDPKIHFTENNANDGQNLLYFMFFSDNVGVDPVTCKVGWRFRYTDA